MLGFLVEPDALATQRMVIAEAGHSDIGERFYKAGPGRGLEAVTAYLQSAMDGGRLRATDARVAAQHLMALFEAETVPLRMLGVKVSTSRAHIRRAIERALAVFLAAYGRSGSGRS